MSVCVYLRVLPSSSLSRDSTNEMMMMPFTLSRSNDGKTKIIRGIFTFLLLICKWSWNSIFNRLFACCTQFILWTQDRDKTSEPLEKSKPNAMWITILENIYMWNKCHTLPIITILLKLSGTQYFPLKRTWLKAEREKKRTTFNWNRLKYTENCSETSHWPRESDGQRTGRKGEFFELIFCGFFFRFFLLLLLMRWSCQLEK